MRDPGNEVVSKVFEQLVGKQITAGFDKQLCVNSSAYRKKYSCETTLINLVEGWREARDVSIMSTDMSKAFDSLHPPLLLTHLSKLKAYGFQDNVVEILKRTPKAIYQTGKIVYTWEAISAPIDLSIEAVLKGPHCRISIPRWYVETYKRKGPNPDTTALMWL